jgi:hypothetical protein
MLRLNFSYSTHDRLAKNFREGIVGVPVSSPARHATGDGAAIGVLGGMCQEKYG